MANYTVGDVKQFLASRNIPRARYMSLVFQNRWLPIVLLFFSNVFMTFAWYGHLKHKSAPLPIVILASWGIAFFEYLFMFRQIVGATRFIPPRN